MVSPSPSRIYLSPPHMGERERELLLDAFDSNWIAPLGPHVDAFERELAAEVGVAEAAALSSGTAALHLALHILKVGRDDRVFVSNFTFAASTNVIRYVGAEPVLIDCDRSTWNMCPDLLAEALEAAAKSNRLPRAVIVVDLYGQCADYDRLIPLCAAYDIPVIEDAAEALGATYKGAPAGSLAACGVVSFNGNKIITTSGGGMLVSDDRGMVEQSRYLATQAREPVAHYEHTTVGFNYRMSNLLAAVGRGQLEMLNQRVAKRRRNFAHYHDALAAVAGVTFMPEAETGRSNRWLTCLTLSPPWPVDARDQVIATLARHNIEARPLWKPMHLQPVFADCTVFGGSISADLFSKGLCLPSGSALTEVQLATISDLVSSTAPRNNR